MRLDSYLSFQDCLKGPLSLLEGPFTETVKLSRVRKLEKKESFGLASKPLVTAEVLFNIAKDGICTRLHDLGSLEHDLCWLQFIGRNVVVH